MCVKSRMGLLNSKIMPIFNPIPPLLPPQLDPAMQRYLTLGLIGFSLTAGLTLVEVVPAWHLTAPET